MEKSEKQKMLAGELYRSNDPELARDRAKAGEFLQIYNSTLAKEVNRRTEVLQALFAQVGSNIEIVPPLFCDYGSNIYVGDDVFINCGCVILDCTSVRIGNKVLVGPSVQLYTASHPIDPEMRLAGLESAAPITIGNNVWIGGGAIICPGVTIGDNTTIGAGSVVTKDLPARVVAVGNPCRVIRDV
ncbi:MAG: sugar O-acetyltransferase [Kastovskya adunca ATA6-11-RM4]|nr:sugar O-acetyltransferase [Kastovskya adunca ATA6-11-RM4]